MVLPQLMIVADACLAMLSIVKAGVETPREDIDGFNVAAWRRAKKAVTAIETGTSNDAEPRAKFESCTAIHAPFYK
jgi:hypothetical protein